MRSLLAAALAATALSAACLLSPPPPARAGALSPARIQPDAAFRDAIVDRPAAAYRTRGGSWGGPIAASTGETVDVTVSDAYPVDPARQQAVADFMAQLYHGPELATVSISVAPIAEVQSICGEGTGGCYDPGRRAIVVPGDDLEDGVSRETILAHEYGHHVAEARDNSPWSAVDWGPKRWATAARVCSRETEGSAFPGDEGDHYQLNPGEAWAETYRLLNYAKQTWTNWANAPWNVDQTFYPDQPQLDAARADVLEPWAGEHPVTYRARWVRPKTGKAPLRGKPFVRTLATPLDGTLTVEVTRATPGTTVAVVDPATGRPLVPASPDGGTVDLCGVRSVGIVVRPRAYGSALVTVTLP